MNEEFTLTISGTNLMILDMLKDLMDHEPPEDAGGHPSAEIHEVVGRRYKEWADQVYGLRLLLGVSVVNILIEGRVGT